MSDNIPPLTRRELVILFYKYRRRLIWAFILPMMLFIAMSFIPTPRYIATSVLIIRMGSEYVYQPESGNSENVPTSNIPFERDQIYKTETAILDSEDLHQQVIETIGLNKMYPDLVEDTWLKPLIARFREVLINWGLIDALTPEQVKAQQMTAALLRFDKRLDILLEKESAVIDLSFGHPDPAIASQTLTTLLDLYFEKRRQIYLEPRAKLAEAQAELLHQKALVAEQAMNDFKQTHKIYSLADQRIELLEARNEITKQLVTWKSRDLDNKLAYYNGQLDQLDALERDFDNRMHDVEITRDEYALFSHKLDEARAFEDIERERAGGVRIIQRPTVPAEPFRLQLYIILAGIFMSVLSVLLTAALTEFLESRFLTPEKLQRSLSLPVLAVFPWRKAA